MLHFARASAEEIELIASCTAADNPKKFGSPPSSPGIVRRRPLVGVMPTLAEAPAGQLMACCCLGQIDGPSQKRTFDIARYRSLEITLGTTDFG